MPHQFYPIRLLGRGGQADQEVRVQAGAGPVGEEGVRGVGAVHRRQGQDGEGLGAERRHVGVPRHRR